MKRLASEVLRDLQIRVARLEKSASQPMFHAVVYQETYPAPEDEYEDYAPEAQSELVAEEKIDSFEELLEFIDREVHPLATWLEWSSSHPEVNGSRRSDWIISEMEMDYRTGDRIRYSFHMNPYRGVELTRDQLEDISTYLHIRMR
jgi:hypothetical protein